MGGKKFGKRYYIYYDICGARTYKDWKDKFRWI